MLGKKSKVQPGTGPTQSLRILLTNGRFPVSLDLARQLSAAGHTVYVLDPMKRHVCKFSKAVKQSFHAPAPHIDAEGYISELRKHVSELNIDLIIPLHEEIFHIALRCRNMPEITDKLCAPPVEMLMALHNKWSFNCLQRAFNLDAPETWLVSTSADIKSLDLSQELAFKPCFGRAKSNLHHHKPGKPLPQSLTDSISSAQKYVAQVWHNGAQYCTYAVAHKGTVICFAIYPVQDTLDGSSCVYFESIHHDKIQSYTQTLVEKLNFSGQMALDFIETDDGRLLAIECNPRATSGIHLFSAERPSPLGQAFTHPDHPFSQNTTLPVLPSPTTKRQLVPGMLMGKSEHNVNFHGFRRHFKHLVTTRDVLFSSKDVAPSFMQPFLVMSYYEICRERKIDSIGEMFQWDLVWEPDEAGVKEVEELVEGYLKQFEREAGKDVGAGELTEGSEAIKA
ncbi:hypothetical protein HK097_007863 [Rhizophlyctis rosea]|uniref:ATP-grasp domain-containing protein n=1 Tax=Rhizophlyctis rosea TaxID=64517 RepID=A0AAD5SD26_9FUNG|nr:hypothetical protein HK097_007863 [Rhizophlyctis rosea]